MTWRRAPWGREGRRLISKSVQPMRSGGWGEIRAAGACVRGHGGGVCGGGGVAAEAVAVAAVGSYRASGYCGGSAVSRLASWGTPPPNLEMIGNLVSNGFSAKS